LTDKFIHRLRQAASLVVKGSQPAHRAVPIPAITDQEIAEARQFFPLDKFFIFGHARSGTTLLTRLVRLHPEVHCNYQGHFFTRLPTIEALVDSAEIEAWFTRRSNRWNQGRDLSPLVMRVVVDFIMEREARPLGVKVVGDKSPNSLLNGEAVVRLHKVYPDGKLIFIVRDGRDAAVSHRFQAFIDATQHLSDEDWAIRADFERNPEAYLRGERSIFTEKGIRAAAEGWVRNLEDTDHQARQLFGDQFIALRYEDLLDQPWREMARLWSFLGVDAQRAELPEALEAELGSNPDKDWQQEKAGELIEPLQKGKSGSWRDLFTARDRDIFRNIAGQTLVDWRYEADLEW
jgi:LPS sulfotransferase NodH